MDILDRIIAKKLYGGGNTGGGGGNTGGGEEWIGDGNTHIWINLPEGRTSPMVGVCPNGTVTVDWGDGSTPDVLTGTSETSVKYTPFHDYSEPGDYIITLSCDGKMGITGDSNYSYLLLRNSTQYCESHMYRNAVIKVELGNGVIIGNNAFRNLNSLEYIYIPDGITSIGDSAWYLCHNLKTATIPDSVINMGNYVFYDCHSLMSVELPSGITSIGSMIFRNCYALKIVKLPMGLTDIGDSAFYGNYLITDINIPNGIVSIPKYMCYECKSIMSLTFPDGITSIGDSAFNSCMNLQYLDFSRSTAVPVLSGSTSFNNIHGTAQIRVPAALVDEWKAATNWSRYASKIVGV